MVGRTGGRASPGPPGTARDRGLLDNLRACASLSTLDSHEPYNFDHVRLGALERRSRDQLRVHAWLTRREDAPPRLDTAIHVHGRYGELCEGATEALCKSATMACDQAAS